MKYIIDIPEYDGDGIDVIWHKDSLVNIRCDEGGITLEANGEGLRSLGEQLLYLSQEIIPSGSHIHLDDFFVERICQVTI